MIRRETEKLGAAYSSVEVRNSVLFSIFNTTNETSSVNSVETFVFIEDDLFHFILN